MLNLRPAAIKALLVLSLVPALAHAQSSVSGVDAFTDGDYAKAVRLLELEIADYPQDADTLFLLGVAYQKIQQPAKAVDALRRVLALENDYADVHLSLGIMYYQMGLAANAEPSLQRAIEVEPENASAWMFLGLTQQALNRNLESIATFERALQLDPELRQAALLNIGVANERIGRHSISQAALRVAIKVNPSSDIAVTARELLQEPVNPEQPASPWRLSLRTGAEYDDNVTTSEIDATTGEDDTAAIFEVSFVYQPIKTQKSTLELGYDLYQSLYSELSDFDLQLNMFYVNGSRQLGGLDLGAEYRFTHANLGGDSLFEIHSLQPRVGFSFHDDLFHMLSYSYQDKDFETDSDRDADQHGVNFDSYYFFADGPFAHVGVRFEDEDTIGPEFDYLGYYINVGLSGAVDSFPATPTSVKVSYQYYLRNYDNETLSIGEEREDRRHTISLGLIQPIYAHLSALLNYQYISAHSNLETSDFSENIVTLSLEVTL